MKLSQKQKDILRFIGNRFAFVAINSLFKTLRIKIKNGEDISKMNSSGKNYVVAFWHGSMGIGWYLHRNHIAALVSQSNDGDILANILNKWDYHIVRGSSSNGGKEALSVMVDLLNQNYSLAITPDGPKGPVAKMKAGVVVAAKRSSVPLFLIGIGIKNKFILKSWDKFEIPKPFTKVNVVYSDPILISNTINSEEISAKLEEYEKLLNELQKEALELCLTY
jgi:lysophospholipid acyltransferase (LPLAT)-like uncharacterized protein